MPAEPIKKRKWDDEEPTNAPPGKVVKNEGEEEVKPVIVAGGGGGEAQAALDAAAQIASKIAAQYANPKVSAQDLPYVAGAREAGDPEFIKDIEINDIRNRYVLTKGPTQQQILADTGASVTTKGVWYPDKSMSTDKDPPLYLHITADTAEKLEAGVQACQDLIDKELGPLLDQSRFRDRDVPRERKKWPEEKLFIELEPMRNFNVRAKVVGPGGLFVKFIQQETQTRVQVKGLGSGFIETDSGQESYDPMHIHVTGPDQVMVDKATEYAKDLLVIVKEEWAKARAALDQPPPQHQQQQQYQQQQQQYPQQGGQQYNYAQQQQYGQYQYGTGVTAPLPSGEAPPLPPGSTPPPPPPSAPTTVVSGGAPVPAQQAGGTATPEEWAAYWNSLDAASQAYYTQYYAQAYVQPIVAVAPIQPVQPPQQAPPPPPPPPPTSAAPSTGNQKGGSGVYGAVPPPPGL